MTSSNQSKAAAVILSTELALKQAGLAHEGIITDTAKLLLSVAHDHKISVESAYARLCEEYERLEAQQKQRKIKAVEAYDNHIAQHQEELNQIRLDIESIKAEAAALQKGLQRKKEIHVQQEKRLKAENFTEQQIQAVLDMGEALDEQQTLQEIKQKNEAEIHLNKRLDAIYEEARTIKETVLYTQ